MKYAALLLLGIIFLTANNRGYCQEDVNGSFETVTGKHIPRGWTLQNTGNQYIMQPDASCSENGKLSFRIDGRMYKDAGADSNAMIYNNYGLLSSVRIKSIELTGWIKLQANTDSAAAIFIQSARGDTTIKAFAPADIKNGQWQQVHILFTPNEDHPWYGFYYGAEEDKQAMAWFDHLSLRINGRPVTDPAGANYEPVKADISWLNASLHPLSSVDADSTGDDIKAMDKMCEGATIVGIGEPTHGTGEALRFKRKLLQYLVTEKGFTTLALEENIATCDMMNAVINNPSASIKDSLLQLPFYNVWKSEEMTAMLEWLRAYNLAHANKVKLTGMDEEDRRIKMTRQLLRDFGAKHDTAILHKTLDTDSCLQALLSADNRHVNDSITLAINGLLSELKGIDTLINSRKQNGQLSSETCFTLETYVRVCRQWLGTRFFNESRDSCMADNIRFYTSFHPKDKILIWAHNFHISMQSGQQKTMGAFLKQQYKGQYVPIGFTTSRGSYAAAEEGSQENWSTFDFENAYRGTCEYIFSKAKDSLYFLSLKNNNLNHRNAAWLSMPVKHLDIGYIKADTGTEYKYEGAINKLFDGIVFCRTTSASHSYLLNQ